MLNKILQIARREYLETVKTKAFIIGILLLPVLMGVMFFFGGKMQKTAFSGPREDVHALVLNHDTALAVSLVESFDSYNANNSGRKIVTHFAEMSEDEGKQAVRSKKFGLLLVVDERTVEGSDHARLFTLPSSDLTLQPTLNRIINSAVSTVRYEQNGFSPELIRKLSRNVWLEDIQLGDKGEGKINRMAGMMLPFAFMFLTLLGIMTSSQGLLNSIIEEKNSRVMEVLLAAVNPLEMMAGKILGQSAIGLTLVALYVLGASTAAIIGGYGEMLASIGWDKIVVLAPNILLGFLLFNAIFAAVGSSVNSVKEAQNFMTPLMLVIVLPMMFWNIIVQQPAGTLAVVLSMVPPVSPLVMVMRVTAMPSVPWLQVSVSLALLAASVCVVVWVAARVFRVGILMYGKAPSIREIARWIKAG